MGFPPALQRWIRLMAELMFVGGLIFIAGFKHFFGMFGNDFCKFGSQKNCVSRVQVDDF